MFPQLKPAQLSDVVPDRLVESYCIPFLEMTGFDPKEESIDLLIKKIKSSYPMYSIHSLKKLILNWFSQKRQEAIKSIQEKCLIYFSANTMGTKKISITKSILDLIAEHANVKILNLEAQRTFVKSVILEFLK